MRASIREIKEHLGTLVKGFIKESSTSSDETVGRNIIENLLTDSRNLIYPQNTLFFAIKTPGGNDGHKFLYSLYEKGVRNFVVEYIPEKIKEIKDINIIVVGNSINALQKISLLALTPDIERVAITGSRGKTTLKEWLFQLMEPTVKISRSPRSYNSQIGVPLSLWQIEPDSKIAIIEAGVSREGEMKKLAACIRPETVIFTNIGDAHADGFSSVEKKAEEKALLADSETVKTVIYCRDYDLVREAVAKIKEGKKIIDWSLTDHKAALFIKRPEKIGNGEYIPVSYIWKGHKNELMAPVENNKDLENMASAIAFMLHEGIEPNVISERFARLHKIGTRLNVTEGVNGCSLIYDTFTNDVSSLLPAIEFMMRRKTPSQKSVVVMSDVIHEKGPQANPYLLISSIINSKADKFIGIGEEMMSHSSLFHCESYFFHNIQEMMEKMSPSDFSDEIILLKGSPDFHFNRIKEMLEVRQHETVMEINLESIVSNFNYFRSQVPSGTGMICMVKASGYGAGSYEIAKTLQDCGASFLAVAVTDEGTELRQNGISMPIMVMNPRSVNYKAMFKNHLEPAVYSHQLLTDLIKEGERLGLKDYPVHIKIDTGMHRMGFTEPEIKNIIRIVGNQKTVKIASVFSHLATADCPDMDDYTLEQLKEFDRLSSLLMEGLPYKIKRHVLNTAGILRFPEYHYDMVRLGIGLYGAETLPPDIEKPLAVVSTLRTVVIAIRDWEKGKSIGYGGKAVLKRNSRIATIPLGYADGMDRRLGNGNITVKVNGKDVPTIGNICMDACMIDVTDVECRVGDAVEIFGPNAGIGRISDTLGTIPYEILTSVSPRVKRVYYRE